MNPFIGEMTKIAGVDDGHEVYKATRTGGYIGGTAGTILGAAAAAVPAVALGAMSIFPGSGGAEEVMSAASKIVVGTSLGAGVLGWGAGRTLGAGVDSVRHRHGIATRDFERTRQGVVAGGVLGSLAAAALSRGRSSFADHLAAMSSGAALGGGVGSVMDSRRRAQLTKVASSPDDPGTYRWTNLLAAGGGIVGAISGPAKLAARKASMEAALLRGGVDAALAAKAVGHGVGYPLAVVTGGLAGMVGGAGSGAVIDAIRHRTTPGYKQDVASGKDPFRWTRRAATVGMVAGGLAGLPHPHSIVQNAIMGAASFAPVGGVVDWARR